jgi:hypothetical protein
LSAKSYTRAEPFSVIIGMMLPPMSWMESSSLASARSASTRASVVKT